MRRDADAALCHRDRNPPLRADHRKARADIADVIAAGPHDQRSRGIVAHREARRTVRDFDQRSRAPGHRNPRSAIEPHRAAIGERDGAGLADAGRIALHAVVRSGQRRRDEQHCEACGERAAGACGQPAPAGRARDRRDIGRTVVVRRQHCGDRRGGGADLRIEQRDRIIGGAVRRIGLEPVPEVSPIHVGRVDPRVPGGGDVDRILGRCVHHGTLVPSGCPPLVSYPLES